MKLFAASALVLSLTLAIGCAEGNAPTPDTAATIANATNKVEANITGMDCSGCSGQVVSALTDIEGVEAAIADVASGDVQVALADGADHEAAKAEIEKVIAGLSEGKYTVNTITVSTGTEVIRDAEGEAQPAPESETEGEASDEQASADDTVYVSATYKVTGIHCTACSKEIQFAVEDIDGVQKVEVDQKAGTVNVAFEDRFDDKVKMDEIKDTIGGLSNGKYTATY